MINSIRKFSWRVLGLSPGANYARYLMIDHAVGIVQHNTREDAKTQEIGSAGSLLGDYLEFGVFRGATFAHAFLRAHKKMPWMRYWAFDSFQGLPEISGLDTGGEFTAGQFACDEQTFRRNLNRKGVDMDRVVIVPGWFEDTLTPELKQEHSLTVASIVYIDADLYESTVPVLQFLTNLVTTGTVIMFDDWFCFRGDPARGVQRAWHEWLEENPAFSAHDYHLFGPFGKSFMMVCGSSDQENG